MGNELTARLPELADAPDLGSGVSRRAGSSPVIRIYLIQPVHEMNLSRPVKGQGRK